MNTKKLKLTTLLIAFAVFVSCIVGICTTTFTASAASYNADNIFNESAYGTIAESSSDIKFAFTGSDNNAISYNRNMAYKWYTQEENEEVTVNYFSMEFSFANLDFDTFTVTFQSSENSKSKDGVTENQIVFLNENDTYYVVFRNNDNKDVEIDELEKHEVLGLSTSDTVEIAFSAGEASGEYKVTLSSGVSNISYVVEDVFTNVRGSYAKYSASKIIPLSFSAEVPQDKTLEVYFKSLNGQSFALNGSGKVEDNAAPVLVVDDDIKTFILGTKLLNFSYEVIDVCDSTVSKNLKYYQYNPEDDEASYETLTASVKVFDQYTYSTDAKEYVSITFELKDDDMEEYETYNLSWYAEDKAGDVFTKTVGSESIEFLAVIRDSESPVYTFLNTNGTEQTIDTTNEAYQNYVSDVAAAAEGLRAGSGYHFYLPALEDMISDNDTSYTGLSFTIYYRTNESDRTLSSKDYDDLEIPVNSTGTYRFKVVATDKQGNGMKFYYDGTWVSVTEDNVWRIEAIPYFEFKVENKGLEVKETEELEYGYMYNNYSIEDFEINGVDGYESEYALYYLEGISFNDVSYADMIKFANECYANGVSESEFIQALAEKTGKTFTDATLRGIDEEDSSGPMDEDEEGWETHDNRYEWKENSKTFTPQEAGYYVLRIKLVDSELWSEHMYAYQIVYVESELDQIYGDDYWLENNLVTVVFAVIAVAAAIGALVVWIVFPSTEKEEFSSVETKTIGGDLADKKKKNKDENKK